MLIYKRVSKLIWKDEVISNLTSSWLGGRYKHLKIWNTKAILDDLFHFVDVPQKIKLQVTVGYYESWHVRGTCKIDYQNCRWIFVCNASCGCISPDKTEKNCDGQSLIQQSIAEIEPMVYIICDAIRGQPMVHMWRNTRLTDGAHVAQYAANWWCTCGAIRG